MTDRLGKEVALRWSTAVRVTLQPCNAKEVNFVNGLRCCKPAFVTLEFATFRDTRFSIPTSSAVSQSYLTKMLSENVLNLYIIGLLNF